MLQTSNTITPREQYMMEAEKENFRMQLDHQKEMKRMEVEMTQMSSRWTTIFRLPLALIKLPVQVLVIIPLFVYAVRGIEPPESLTSFIDR
jgi:hypothetical protein